MKQRRTIPRINEESTVKVIILYILDQLQLALSFQTLTEIILWDGEVNYFVFADCLQDLTEKGALVKKKEAGSEEELYSITPFGKGILENVSGMLLASMKSQLMRSATRLLAFKHSGRTVGSKVEKENEGYRLVCSVKDRKYDLLEVKLYLDNLEEAQLLQKRFDEKAEHIYRSILALLSGDAKLLE